MFTLDLDVSGDVERKLFNLDTAISPIALMAFLGFKVDPYLRSRAKARFNSEGDDVTGGWAPLSPATVKIREELGFPGAHPINKRTGDLEDFITEHRSAVVAIAGGANLVAPGVKPSGKMLKKLSGAQKGEGTAPARPVLGMNEQDLAAVLTLLATHVVTEVSGGDR